MWRALCKASGAIAIGVMLMLGAAIAVSAQDIRDFEDIAASPVTVTPDASGQFAVLTVDTSIDVACSVVYGTDESFGLIAVDADMNGGAHADHHPVMAGLEPETDYVYRLQGTAPDGTIYISETFSFTTPAAAVRGTNLALEATVIDVSSEWSDAFAAELAIDGDPSTEWSTRDDGDAASITLDLGEHRAIASVAFRTRSMSDGSAITDTFLVHADGMEYGPFPAGPDTVALPIEARTLRFDVASSSGGNTGAIEIEIYAPEA